MGIRSLPVSTLEGVDEPAIAFGRSAAADAALAPGPGLLRSLLARLDDRLRGQILIELLRFRGRASAGAQRGDAEHADGSRESGGDDVADLHRLARFLDPLAVELDLAALDRRRRERAGL